MAKKKSKLIFSTNDYYGNLVELDRETWERHILNIVEGHPEMVGYEGLVESIISNPYEIRLSTLSATALAFISAPLAGPSPDGIRALVKYENGMFMKGSTQGRVSTAYPVDIIRYGSPKLGKTIYSKADKRKG